MAAAKLLIQSTISLFILVLGRGQTIVGLLVENYGRNPVAIVGLFIYMISASMAALATTPTIFLLHACYKVGGVLHLYRRLQRRARSHTW